MGMKLPEGEMLRKRLSGIVSNVEALQELISSLEKRIEKLEKPKKSKE